MPLPNAASSAGVDSADDSSRLCPWHLQCNDFDVLVDGLSPLVCRRGMHSPCMSFRVLLILSALFDFAGLSTLDASAEVAGWCSAFAGLTCAVLPNSAGWRHAIAGLTSVVLMNLAGWRNAFAGRASAVLLVLAG